MVDREKEERSEDYFKIWHRLYFKLQREKSKQENRRRSPNATRKWKKKELKLEIAQCLKEKSDQKGL